MKTTKKNSKLEKPDHLKYRGVTLTHIPMYPQAGEHINSFASKGNFNSFHKHD